LFAADIASDRGPRGRPARKHAKARELVPARFKRLRQRIRQRAAVVRADSDAHYAACSRSRAPVQPSIPAMRGLFAALGMDLAR
jgi:hypothetical protein